MKGFSMVTAAVLVVNGVGLVSGLSPAQTFRLPPPRTYSLNGVEFSVAFPGQLGPGPAVDGLNSLPSVQAITGTTDSDHLVFVVLAAKSGCPSDGGVLGYLCSYHSSPPPSCSTAKAKVVHLRPGASGEVCADSTQRRWGNVSFDLDAISTEGLSAAEAVVNSFRLLGTGSHSP